MKQAMVVMIGLFLAATGCTTVSQVNPVREEVAYHTSSSGGAIKPVEKSLVVVAFEDVRPRTMTSESLMMNWVPFILASRGAVTHPEAVYSQTLMSTSRPVFMVGTMNEAIASLLARDLHMTRQFSNVQFVKDLPTKTDQFDLVLRGRLLKSTLIEKRYSYYVGPLAMIPYILGAPLLSYEPDLVVEWRLYDSNGKPVGDAHMVGIENPKPMVQRSGLYYGWYRNHRLAPIGVLSEAIREVNSQIVTRVAQELTE
jgi:hypothetical protein